MPRVEIAWRERGPKDVTYCGYIRTHENVDIMTAVERTFKEWLRDKIENKSVVIADLEFYVDGEYYPLSTREKDQYLQRVYSVAR